MAVSMTTVDGRFNDTTIVDTDTDENAVFDITGGTGSIYYIEAVNAWSGSSVFLKIYDLNVVAVGTSDPIFVMKIPASTTKSVVIPDGIPFTTGLSFAATDQAGSAGAGTPIPTNDLTVRIIAS
jgi:hypothetical protein|tara:strand:+ start:261 stop:632 length:372 start_codon:yes stop_codon:yes gene_type:complete